MKIFEKLFSEITNKKMFPVIIMFLLGIFLLVFSNLGENNDITNVKNNESVKDNIEFINKGFEKNFEIRLNTILSKMEGVGRVNTMITTKNTGHKLINKDNQTDNTKTKEVDSSGGTRENQNYKISEKTILINKESGKTEPIILDEEKPEILGIIIVAEGGDDPIIKEKLIRAAQTISNVAIYKIQVYKMN